MPTLAGKVEKTMEAESVGLLKHILQTELRQARERNAFDIVMFIGVDGRIFASEVPPNLDPRQYRLMNLVKQNLSHICNQLSGQNMMLSVQQYDVGTIIISGVGDKAFLVFLASRPVDLGAMQDTLRAVFRASTVMKHLFEERPITPASIAAYDEDVARDLRGLTRALFVEKFEDTRGYKRNVEVLEFLRKRLQALVVGRNLGGHRALRRPAAEAERERRQRDDQAGVEDESAYGHGDAPIRYRETGSRGPEDPQVSRLGSPLSAHGGRARMR